MGLVTDLRRAPSKPSYIIEASRVSVTEFPHELSSVCGLLILGDIAVIDDDFEELPYIRLPKGSRVRDQEDPDVIHALPDEGYICTERKVVVEDKEGVIIKPLARKCAVGCAAVHMHLCKCQHWRVLRSPVFVRTKPDLTSKDTTSLYKGDLICPGRVTDGQAVDRGMDPDDDVMKKWVRLNKGALKWSEKRFNAAPDTPFDLSQEVGFVLKAHREYGKLLAPVKSEYQKKLSNDRQGGTDGTTVAADAAAAGSTAISTASAQAMQDKSGKRPQGWTWSAHAAHVQGGTAAQSAAAAAATAVANAGYGDAGDDIPNAAVEPLELYKIDNGRKGPAAQKGDSHQRVLSRLRDTFHRETDSALEALAGKLHPTVSWETVAARLQAWVVKDLDAESAVHASSDAGKVGAALLWLHTGDVLLQTNAVSVRAANPLETWLALRAGDRIFREGQLLATVRAEHVHVLVIGQGGTELLEPWVWQDPEVVAVQSVSGFGEPWAVVHKQVVIRSGARVTELPLGFASQGDIIGAETQDGEWIQLSASTDVRQRDSEMPQPRLIATAHMDPWMLTQHASMGTLLRRMTASDVGEDGCTLKTPRLLLSSARLGLYSRVVHLCHRRIWEDNTETLWEGHTGRIPLVETLEAKLFHSGVQVLHARKGGRFVGGAIIRTISMRIGTEEKIQEDEERAKRIALKLEEHEQESSTENAVPPVETMQVGYIDCFATERGCRVGKTLWKAISRMPFPVIALHSVLLPSTVDFWRGTCGFKRMEDDVADCHTSFSKTVQVHSQMTLDLELSELVAALPSSKLPLFVWYNVTLLENWKPPAR